MKKIFFILTLFLFATSILLSASNSFENIKSKADRPSVALVLSGGGAKGLVHVGILEEIERLGIPIDKIYGTSMGSLIGGFYCAGYSPSDLENMIKNNNLSKLFTSFVSSGYNEILEAFDFNSNNLFSISLSQGIGGTTGLIDDYRILNFFYEYLGNIPDILNFETDLEIPFNCNSINMINGKEIIFKNGSLIKAMRSSMSIPLVFEAVDNGTEILMDGGLYNNMPVHLAIEDGYDIIIAVSASTDEDLKYESYKSFSGTVLNLVTIIVRRGMEGEGEKATLFIPVDTSEFSTLSFNKSLEILERGRETAKKYHEDLAKIADCFTEEQKKYKDPNRKGSYFTKYSEKKSSVFFSASSESRKEDLLKKSRLSVGFYGGIGFSFSYLEEDDSEFRVFPTFSLRFFLKDIGKLPISIDTRLKAKINKDVSISSEILLRLTKDSGERFFLTSRLSGSFGSLTWWTNKISSLSINKVESEFKFKTGFKLTDERTHSVNLNANLNLLRTLNTNDEKGIFTSCINNFVQLDGIFYPGYKTGFFETKGTRIDLLGAFGFFRMKKQEKKIFYKIQFSFESSISLDKKNSIWLEGCAYTHRGLVTAYDTYEEYGGWNGMPGENYGTMYSDFIMTGLGYQRKISEDIFSSYFVVQLKAALRSKDKFEIFNYPDYAYESNIPFDYCINEGIWNFGIAFGYGLKSPLGDFIIGVGINSELRTSFYIEIK